MADSERHLRLLQEIGFSEETDVGIRAHDAAVAHLDLCFESLDDESVEIETMAPFCGCSDCIVREVLYAAWPILAGSDGSS